MSPVPAGSARPLPPWLVYALNVVIVCHLGAIVALVLASPSGLLPTPMGVSMAEGPQFAKEIVDKTKDIQQALHLSSDYHFASNRMGLSVARFEVLLKDKTGHVIKTLKFPEPDANFWVRHRQS